MCRNVADARRNVLVIFNVKRNVDSDTPGCFFCRDCSYWVCSYKPTTPPDVCILCALSRDRTFTKVRDYAPQYTVHPYNPGILCSRIYCRNPCRFSLSNRTHTGRDLSVPCTIAHGTGYLCLQIIRSTCKVPVRNVRAII